MFCYYYLWCFAIVTCDVLLLLWPVMFCYYYYDLWCFAIMTCDVLLLLLYLWCGGRRWTGHDIQPQFLQQLGTFTNMYEYIEKLSTVWPWLAITGHDDAIQKCSYWAKKKSFTTWPQTHNISINQENSFFENMPYFYILEAWSHSHRIPPHCLLKWEKAFWDNAPNLHWYPQTFFETFFTWGFVRILEPNPFPSNLDI